MVDTSSKCYTVSTLLFHKDGVENISIKNCMSHFSIFVQTKANVKLANGNTRRAHGMGRFYVITLTIPLYIHFFFLITSLLNL